MKERILIIHKGGRVHTWCEDLRLGFESLGHDARAVALRDRTPEERRIEKTQGLRLMANPATITRLADAARAHKPGTIVLLNSIGLPEQAHEALRNAAPGARIIAWLADHVEKPPGNCQPNLDAVFPFDSATIPLLENFYSGSTSQVRLLPLAVNPQRFRNHGLPWNRRQPGLAFVGNHSKDRLDVIAQIRSLGVGLASYGPRASCGWKIWRRRRISPERTAAIYGSHQMVLNMLQHPNTIHGLNLRAFEIPCCGGIGSYPLTPDLDGSFVPGEEIIAYKDIDDLACQIRNLASNPDLAARIIQNGLDRVLAEHTYTHRAISLIST